MSTVTMNHSFESMTGNKTYANFVHCLFRLRAKALNLGCASYFYSKLLKSVLRGYATHWNGLMPSQITFFLLWNTNKAF